MPWTPIDFTARGIPKITDGDVMPGFKVGYNAQSTALDTALDSLETDIQDADSVATVAALPVSGNWVGRIIFCEEDELLRVWDGTGWVAYGGKTPYFYGERTSAALPSTGGGDQAWVSSTQLARSMSLSSGVITVEVPGIYQIHMLVDWVTVNTTGQRNLGVATTGTNLGPSRSSEEPPTISTMSQLFTADVLCGAGDTITPFVAHNSAASLSIKGEISIRWVASI